MRRAARFHDGGPSRAYLVFLLAAILAFNGLDGTAIGIALPSIKSALHLTDTELGVLTGIAFSLFYSTLGIPLGRWSDRGNRVVIISLTTGLWGVMVMLVGATRSFLQLLMVRIGVAVGEAGCVPAAYSLIADYFAREERPQALASYWLGAYVSILVGYVGTGWLTFRYGWRTMFFCIGVPSVLVAPVAWLTLRDPRRATPRSVPRSIAHTEAPGIVQVIQALWGNRTFRYVVAVTCVNALFGSGLVIWQPSFFTRSYGIRAEQLGMAMSIVYGLGGIIGVYSGGYLASRYAPKNERLQLTVLALLNVGYGVISACIYLSKSSYISLGLLGVTCIGGTLGAGPLFATTQMVIPERMRAVSISVMYLLSNLVGGGLGPLLVGTVSDAFHPYLGSESLRYALMAVCPGYLLGGWLMWQAARSVTADAQAAVDSGFDP